MLRRVNCRSLVLPALGCGARQLSVDEYAAKRTALKESVRANLKENSIFTQVMFDKCFDRFFGLDLEWTYVTAFNAETVAKHLIGFATATAEAESGKPFFYSYAKPGADSCFWICDLSTETQMKTIREIETYFLREKFDDVDSPRGVSLRSYVSPGGNTVLFTLHAETFPHPDSEARKFTKIEDFATKHFLQVRNQASLDRYTEILKRLSHSIKPVFSVRQVDEDTLNITIAFLPDRASYIGALTTLFNQIQGAKVTRSFLETFSGGQQVYSFFVKGATKAMLEAKANQIGMLPHRPDHEVTHLYERGVISPLEVNFCHSLIIFAFYFAAPPPSHDFQVLNAALAKDEASLKALKNLRQQMHQEVLTEEFLSALVSKHITFIKDLFAAFERGTPSAETISKFYATVKSLTESEVERSVLSSFVRFVEAIKKTNFFKADRAAAAFRLDPAVMLRDLGYPATPFGVFFVVGPQFRGFHVRFADIARGGIRMVLSKTPAAYVKNRRTLFQENYNLAHTQMLKNKDICESGSKGVILVSPRRGPEPAVVYMQYIDALLDVLLPGESGVRDALPNREILFLGPDENTSGELPSDAAYHARDRGYKEWKSFTTGKGQDIGGIPHEIYGMTTESVRANVLSIYKEKGIVDQTKLTKFQTGGPDGDLGSNEIMLSSEKYLGVVDKSGVLYDPEGLNKEELVRLAKGRPNLTVKDFDQSKLSPKGFFVGEKETHRTLPDGTHVASGEKFRDEFHFTNYVTCDIFVPCGGRPAAVTLENVHKLLVGCPDTFTGETMLYGKLGDLASQGKTRFKYIVEGANLFITQDARLALENVGVVLVKDSAANKGGVTSSSFEVLAGLSLSAEEHDRLMCVKNGVFPEFYNKMVQEIVERIRANAVREYHAVSAEVAKGRLDGKRTLISDELSRRIVQMRTTIIKSDLFDNVALRKLVLKKYIPQVLQAQVPIDTIIERVPENYLRACFSVYIASNYVYSTGLGATEFEFFQYMNKLHAEAAMA